MIGGRSGLPHAPTPFERLLLSAALSSGDECREAWARANHVAGRTSTLDQASYRLLPLLYRNLEAQGVDDPRMGVLKGIYRFSWCSNQQLFHAAGGALERLHAAGIQTLVLKGAAVGALYYRDLAARPVWDVDVLVHRADVLQAGSVLQANGWAPPKNDSRSLEYMMRFRHARHYEQPDGRGIDLHWCPLFEPVSADDLWESTVPVSVGGVETRALSAADELLVACVHGLFMTGAPVRWISDAATIARAANVDWAHLLDRAERWRLTARGELALRMLRDEFAVPVPDHVLGRLRRARRPYHERVTHRALVHRPRRGVTTIVEWDRYRRLHALGSRTAAAGFARYMRDLTDAPSWARFVARYRRRAQRAVAEPAAAE